MKNLVVIFLTITYATHTAAQDFISGTVQNFKLESPVVADFTGDGKPDVAGIQFNSGLGKLVLLANNGGSQIGFTSVNTGIFLNLLENLTAADLDGDGDLDLVVVTENNFNVIMLRNNGDGSFLAEPLGISGPQSVKIADMDNDSDLDIVGINSNGSASIYYNLGLLQFETFTLLSSSLNLRLLELSDMNNDGKIDIVIGISEFTGTQILLLLNNGPTQYAQIPVVADFFNNIECLAISDLNSDGQKDIIAARSFNCELFLNKGNNVFEQSTLIASNGLIRSVAIGDYNGDGLKDLVIGHNSSEIRWHKNLSNTSLQFETAIVGGVSPAFSLANGDLDGDGDTDIVTTNGNFWWYENKIVQETSTHNPLQVSSWHLSPNPFTREVNFENPQNVLLFIEVFDFTGNRVSSVETRSSSVNLIDLPKGAYLIKATAIESRMIYIAKTVKH